MTQPQKAPTPQSEIERVGREIAELWKLQEECDVATGRLDEATALHTRADNMRKEASLRRGQLERYAATLEPQTARETLILSLLHHDQVQGLVDDLVYEIEQGAGRPLPPKLDEHDQIERMLSVSVIRGLERAAGVTAADLGLTSYFPDTTRYTWVEAQEQVRSAIKKQQSADEKLSAEFLEYRRLRQVHEAAASAQHDEETQALSDAACDALWRHIERFIKRPVSSWQDVIELAGVVRGQLWEDHDQHSHREDIEDALLTAIETMAKEARHVE